MSKKAVQLTIRGRVQGVFFRVSARDQASSLGLVGWVRNQSDGSVGVYAEGEEPALKQFIQWCRQGPAHAHVEDVDILWKRNEKQYTDFQIE